jgi:hypothetical protein
MLAGKSPVAWAGYGAQEMLRGLRGFSMLRCLDVEGLRIKRPNRF